MGFSNDPPRGWAMGRTRFFPTFTELQQVILNNLIQLFEAFFLIRLTATCINLHCYSPFPGIKTKCLFWDYLDARFLTPRSCGGMHYCRAACHTSVSLLFISHSNYATPTKTWKTNFRLTTSFLQQFFILIAVSHNFFTLLVMSRPSCKMSSSGCIDKYFQRTKVIVLV